VFGDNTEGPSRFALFHAVFATLCDRIKQHDHDLTAIAENVHVRLVSAFIACVNPDLETGNDDFRQDYT